MLRYQPLNGCVYGLHLSDVPGAIRALYATR